MKYSTSLSKKYTFLEDLSIESGWTEPSLSVLCSSIAKLQDLSPQDLGLWSWIKEIKYAFMEMRFGGLTTTRSVKLNPRGLTEWTVVHELAHAWDASQDWQLSDLMRRVTHSHFKFKQLHNYFPHQKLFWYHVGRPPAPCGRRAFACFK